MFEFLRDLQESKIVNLQTHWYPILRTRYGKEYKDIDSGAKKIVWNVGVQDFPIVPTSNKE